MLESSVGVRNFSRLIRNRGVLLDLQHTSRRLKMEREQFDGVIAGCSKYKTTPISQAFGTVSTRVKQYPVSNRHTCASQAGIRRRIRAAIQCPDRKRLVEQDRAATSSLDAAASVLTVKTGAEFPEAQKESAAARAECERTRTALQKHKAEHPCAPLTGWALIPSKTPRATKCRLKRRSRRVSGDVLKQSAPTNPPAPESSTP